MDLIEELIPPEEEPADVTAGEIGGTGDDAGEGRRNRDGSGRDEAGMGGGGCRFGPPSLEPFEEERLGVVGGFADEVNVSPPAEDAVRFEVCDANADEEAFLPGGVVGKGGLPFRLAEDGGHVGGGQHGDDAGALLKGAVHVAGKDSARLEIPGLEDCLVPHLF